jgi:hypothetical protein
MSKLPPEIAKVLASSPCPFGKADEIRMFIPDVVGRLNRLYASTVARRDVENQELNRFIAEYKSDPVAEAHGYDPIPQEVMLNEQTERVMFANVAVAIDAEKERFVIYICEQIGLDHKNKKGKANFDVACESLKTAIGVDPRKLPGAELHEQARVLANCFKHEGWKIDAEAAKFLEGDVGDEIAFEELDWPAMIAATGQVLDEIVKRLK